MVERYRRAVGCVGLVDRDWGLQLVSVGGPEAEWQLFSQWLVPISGRYYADIRQTIPASDQEMNSILAELSRVRPPLPAPVGTCWVQVIDLRQ